MQVRLKTCDMLSAMGATSFEEKLNKKQNVSFSLKYTVSSSQSYPSQYILTILYRLDCKRAKYGTHR